MSDLQRQRHGAGATTLMLDASAFATHFPEGKHGKRRFLSLVPGLRSYGVASQVAKQLSADSFP
jgi:hypothetical protein